MKYIEDEIPSEVQEGWAYVRLGVIFNHNIGKALNSSDSNGQFLNIIVNIKSKILDLVIRGKLVPQYPNDEPASVLLEGIRAEKEELIKQGKNLSACRLFIKIFNISIKYCSNYFLLPEKR